MQPKNMRVIAACLLGLALFGCGEQSPESVPPPEYDLVLAGGRVIDPESGLDGLRNIGILDDHIAAVTADTITAERVIDVTGLAVAPGFIDLHAHGQNDESFALMAQDGVTTAFELEVGTARVADWYNQRENGQILNYGVSAGHMPVRMAIMNDPGDLLPAGVAASEAATPEQINEIAARVEQGLREGAVAVGFGIAYTPAAEPVEYDTVLRIAARYGVSSHIHARSGVDGVTEAITLAREADAPLHIVHINSNGGPVMTEVLELVRRARDAGQDVTTEAYPYSASMTDIRAALFNDWETWGDDEFEKFQWVETGERLTRDSFAHYRALGGMVIIHLRTEEMTRNAVVSPLVMIASDGRIVDGAGHPRTSGSYSKVLGKYVREEGLFPLAEAIRKMTLAPARRLEPRVPEMRDKGRIRIGADADITVFDPETITDRSTYSDPTLASVGVHYLLINGTLVVDGQQPVPSARPGRPVRAAIQ
jgi:N-acyl-D-aspartate/D-glutamate deacylase